MSKLYVNYLIPFYSEIYISILLYNVLCTFLHLNFPIKLFLNLTSSQKNQYNEHTTNHRYRNI